MCAGEAEGPRSEDIAVSVVDEDVVLFVVGEEEEASVADLEHFVTIVDGIFCGIGFAPEFVDAVLHSVVADDCAMELGCSFGLCDEVRCGECGETGSEEGATGEGIVDGLFHLERDFWSSRAAFWKRYMASQADPGNPFCWVSQTMMSPESRSTRVSVPKEPMCP